MGKILGIAIQNYGSLKNIKMGKLYSDQSGSELGNMVAIIGPSGNGKAPLRMRSALFPTASLRMWRAPVTQTTGADMTS